jgi:TIR domain
MRVFLCWSGAVSEKIATAFHEFLGDVIQEIKPFFSSESIRKGDRWRTEIAQQLAETDFGVLCLTEDNLEAPWILFEAGALSKNVVNSRVTSLLGGIQPTDVKEPLSQFHHTRMDREDILKLLKELNAALPKDKPLDADRLNRLFDMHWPKLEQELMEAMKAKSTDSAPKRDTEDMVAETLELVREMKRSSESFPMWFPPGTLPPLGAYAGGLVPGNPALAGLLQPYLQLMTGAPQTQPVGSFVRRLSGSGGSLVDEEPSSGISGGLLAGDPSSHEAPTEPKKVK